MRALEPKQEPIVITGARGNVGSVLVRRLINRYPLALLGRESGIPPGLQSSTPVAGIGAVDVLDEASVVRGVAAAREQLGPARALIHTVGAWRGGRDIETASLAEMRELFELNYWSAVHLIRALLPDLKASAHGRIILFGSVAAVRGSAQAAAYAASKAALLRFAEVLAEELVTSSVNVQVLLPSTIDTPQNRAAMPSASYTDWVTPDELASSVEFLLSPAASAIRFAALPMS